MKLHPKVVAKILNYVQNLGGHKDDTKLRKVLETMEFSPYTRKATNDTVLVETADYVKELQNIQRNQ